MDYEFSWGAFMIGFLVVLAGTGLVLFHRAVADNLGSGVASYERYKLFGLIGTCVGFIVMLNLHMVILELVLGSLFRL